MYDGKGDQADSQAATTSTESPTPQATTYVSGRDALDEAVQAIEDALISKKHPTPLFVHRSFWLTLGYFRVATSIRYEAWELEYGGKVNGLWSFTGKQISHAISCDHQYDQLTMEGTDDGE